MFKPMWQSKEHFYAWLSGFCDGEACFMIETKRTGSKGKDDRYYIRTGRVSQFYPSLLIGLRDDDKFLLDRIVEELGVGYVYHRAGVKKNSGTIHEGNPQAMLRIFGVRNCLRMIEIFDKFTPMSKKRRDYQIWREFTMAKATTQDYDFLRKSWEDIKAVRKYKEAMYV